MAEIATLIQNPRESMRQFNARIREQCESMVVTSASLSIIEFGFPKVTLISDYIKADASDVDDDLADEDEEADASDVDDDFADEEADIIPAGDRISCAVIRLRAREEMEDNIDVISGLAGASVVSSEDVFAEEVLDLNFNLVRKWPIVKDDKGKDAFNFDISNMIKARIGYNLTCWAVKDEEEDDITDDEEDVVDAEVVDDEEDVDAEDVENADNDEEGEDQ